MSDYKIGETINNFKVVGFFRKRENGSPLRKFYEILCIECGAKKTVRKHSFHSRKASKCVCSHEGRFTEKHGLYNSKEHIAWASMKQRCYDKNCASYRLYGERGISVCEEWVDNFERFLSDMGKKPKGMSLDRIDPNKGYYKDNCRWATASDQAHNKRALTKGFKGVNYNLGKFVSRIMLNYKSIRIGSYDCPIEAAINYDKKAIEIRGDNALTNKMLGKFCGEGLRAAIEYYKDKHNLILTRPDDLYIQALMRDGE